MSRYSSLRRSAFTLVELLVVVGVIAMLLAFMLPVLHQARGQACAVACQSNLRQIAVSALMYAQEQGRYVGYAPGLDRKMLLHRYLQQGTSNSDVAVDDVWQCPDNVRPDEECGYGFNTNLNWSRLNKIRNWSGTVALCDSGLRDKLRPTLSTMCNRPSKTTVGSAYAYRPNPRHPNQTVGVAFVDAHVQLMPMAEPFYPGPVGMWSGNGVTDCCMPEYKDELWDLH